MSWLSSVGGFFIKAEHYVVVGMQDAAPYVADAQKYTTEIGTIPVVGGPIVTILNAIAAAEKLIPAAGAGATKKMVVTAIVNSAYPGIDAATLSRAIDEIVSAFTALDAATAPIVVAAAKATIRAA